MDRADKIFTILSGLALVAVLLWQHKSVGQGPVMNASAAPALIADSGPAYLLSNLPSHRDRDDTLPLISYFP